MGRSWNRLLSAVYARVPLFSRLYARRLGLAGVGPPPWAPATLHLERAAVALVTLAGVHLRAQPPFDMETQEGDVSFRVIGGSAALADLTVTHDYYDHTAADRDMNVVFPLERLRELAAAGWIGKAAPRHVGAMGHVLGSEERRLVADTAPAIARMLKEDAVDYVVLSPG